MNLSEKSDVAETFKHPIDLIEVKTEVKQFDKEEKRVGYGVHPYGCFF